MKSFNSWYNFRKNEDSSQAVGHNAIGGVGLSGGEESAIGSLFQASKLAWERYRSDTLSFFKRLAAQDPDIKTKVDELEDGSARVSSAVKRSAGINDDDTDEIVPPSSDGTSGNGESGED